jgi:hypothetical protein
VRTSVVLVATDDPLRKCGIFRCPPTLHCVLYEASAVILRYVKIDNQTEDKLETGSLSLQLKDKMIVL